jgi:hypothetical protein
MEHEQEESQYYGYTIDEVLCNMHRFYEDLCHLEPLDIQFDVSLYEKPQEKDYISLMNADVLTEMCYRYLSGAEITMLTMLSKGLYYKLRKNEFWKKIYERDFVGRNQLELLKSDYKEWKRCAFKLPYRNYNAKPLCWKSSYSSIYNGIDIKMKNPSCIINSYPFVITIYFRDMPLKQKIRTDPNDTDVHGFKKSNFDLQEDSPTFSLLLYKLNNNGTIELIKKCCEKCGKSVFTYYQIGAVNTANGANISVVPRFLRSHIAKNGEKLFVKAQIVRNGKALRSDYLQIETKKSSGTRKCSDDLSGYERRKKMIKWA